MLGASPMLGGQPSLDFLTQIPQAIQSATGWQPGTTPAWMPDWLRNLSASNTAQTQATQQSLAALPPRYAMTPQDINTAMSLGMSAGTIGEGVGPKTSWDDEAAHPDYVYHATSFDRAQDIAADSKLQVHRPDYGTDQDAWPDGSTQKRAYFTANPKTASSFVPEGGPPTLLRIPKAAADFKTERGTGDIYSAKPIGAHNIEFLSTEGWQPIVRPPQLGK